MLNSDTKRQVQKNAKAHNVYRHCLCFIFDQTTMAREQNHSPCFNNKIGHILTSGKKDYPCIR